MNKRKHILLIPILLLGIHSLSAAVPPWVMLEKGKAAFENRNLTLAMDTLLDAVEAEPEYPEAEYWLGRVYEAQGQAVLAEEQYRRAIELSVYLRVPEDVITYRYSLASLLIERSRFTEAEAILHSIADEEGASRPKTLEMEHRYIDLITASGLDELLFLYRDELKQSLDARCILGETAWNDGRYRTALLNSTRTVLSMLSTSAEVRKSQVPEWRFDIDAEADSLQPDRDVRYPGSTDGTVELVEYILAEMPVVSDWLQEEGLWPQLYLLACSLYAEGYAESAKSVWTILTDRDSLTGEFSGRLEAGTWGRLAARQLEQPFISKGSLAP